MIVNCMVYRSGHPAETVDIEDISEIIQDTDAFIWLEAAHENARKRFTINKKNDTVPS